MVAGRVIEVTVRRGPTVIFYGSRSVTNHCLSQLTIFYNTLQLHQSEECRPSANLGKCGNGGIPQVKVRFCEFCYFMFQVKPQSCDNWPVDWTCNGIFSELPQTRSFKENNNKNELKQLETEITESKVFLLLQSRTCLLVVGKCFQARMQYAHSILPYYTNAQATTS